MFKSSNRFFFFTVGFLHATDAGNKQRIRPTKLEKLQKKTKLVRKIDENLAILLSQIIGLEGDFLLCRHQALDDSSQKARAAGILHAIARSAVERRRAKVAANSGIRPSLIGGIQDRGLGQRDLARGTGRREAVRLALEVDHRHCTGWVDGAIDQRGCLSINELDLRRV